MIDNIQATESKTLTAEDVLNSLGWYQMPDGAWHEDKAATETLHINWLESKPRHQLADILTEGWTLCIAPKDISKPMTDLQLETLLGDSPKNLATCRDGSLSSRIVRAVEAFHGIGAGKGMAVEQVTKELYYLASGSCSGNEILWWAKGGMGYTTDLLKAQKFTFDEVVRIHQSRQTDVPWLCSEVEAVQRPCVDFQDLRRSTRSTEKQIELFGKAIVRRGNGKMQTSSIPVNEHESLLSSFWSMLMECESQANNTGNALLKLHVEQLYQQWNRITGDDKQPAWINRQDQIYNSSSLA